MLYPPGMRTAMMFVAVAAIATGCHRGPKDIPATTSDELAASLAKGECKAVDVNSPRTRAHMGVVPNAVLLSDSEDFKPDELPADKDTSLVFYCGDKSCPSSHVAAEHAIAQGYTHVKVMPEGIAGWVSSGKTVTKI